MAVVSAESAVKDVAVALAMDVAFAMVVTVGGCCER
jgi:hypothetical protein